MKVVVKYEVKYRPFTDRETKKEVKVGEVIDIDIERMKTLNEHNVGRVIDIIVEDEPVSSSTNSEVQKENPDAKETVKEKYSQEQLQELTVNDLKDLATKMGIELTKAKKDEIIEEILKNQK